MPFSGQEVIKALRKHGFEYVRQKGSHAILKYRHPENPDDIRTVTVPRHREIDTGTLRSIAEQAGANDFQAFKNWIRDVL